MKNKILKYMGISLIVIGLGILSYHFINNFFIARRESEILTTWDIEFTPLTNPATDEESVQSYSDSNDDLKLEKDTKLIDPEKKLPFKISIPSIEIEWIVNEGTDYATLRKGPGFYIPSTLPGEEGTTVVSGHRTTYGAPFSRLDELKEGDKIIIETPGNEKFTYIVIDKKEVAPTDMNVLEKTDYPSLVLTTCTPKYFATRRLIVFAKIFE